MKITTLTPDLSKRARRELALSQNDVIKATGIQSYKLKQWEGRGLSIELVDIRKLSDFYELQGVNLSELVDHINQGSSTGREAQSSEASQSRPPLQNGFTHTPRPGFMISDQLTPDVVEKLMQRMEANDDRIGELTAETFAKSFLGDVSDDTEAKARDLVGTLAENHIIFRCLQGRNVVSAMRDEPKTLGEFLTQMMNGSPVLPMLLANSEAATTRTAIKPSTKALALASNSEQQ